MTLYLGENLISGVATPIEGARNIGQIIQSTIPLTDAGLHLLDGALISGSGIYADFVTYIAGLVSTYPDLFETEANWQASVTSFGSCEKFVYDSVNNTVRLPKYTSEHGYLVKSYSNGADWYRIYSDGWCEQGGVYTSSVGNNVKITVNLLKQYMNTNYNICIILNRSSDGGTGIPVIYGNPTTTTFVYMNDGDYDELGFRWQASGYIDITDYAVSEKYEYLVIATSTKTQIEVDIDEIVTDLNGKADVDLSNINPTQTVKNTIVGWGMPDYNSKVTIATTTYEAPCDGYVWYRNNTAQAMTVTVGGIEWYTGSVYGTSGTAIFPISKGETSVASTLSSVVAYFIPLKGVS